MSSLTLMETYENWLKAHQFSPNKSQLTAIKVLEHAQLELESQNQFKLKFWQNKKNLVKGIYLWGSVGRGKTMLMDLFYDTLTLKYKKRMHYQHFMKFIHESLANYQGQKNPLNLVADQLTKKTTVLCLDEFVVNDVADAMLLGELINLLFKRHVTLVITSNIIPDHLYQDGLQRTQFLPAIEAIKLHTQIMYLESEKDYRGLNNEGHRHYFHPITEKTTVKLTEIFIHTVGDEYLTESIVMLDGRSIPTRMQAEDIIWFDFNVLCGPPRSQLDYISLAERYTHIIISDIFQMQEKDDDIARRFIYLIDECYDQNIQLTLSATIEKEALYMGSRLAFEFKRTLSRLNQML